MELATRSSTLDRDPVVTVVGELDLATAPDLTAALAAALPSERDTLTIDLSGVTFCDSTGLKVLLSAPGHRPVRLRGPSPALLRILDLTGTRERFEVVS